MARLGIINDRDNILFAIEIIATQDKKCVALSNRKGVTLYRCTELINTYRSNAMKIAKVINFWNKSNDSKVNLPATISFIRQNDYILYKGDL